MSDKRQHKSSQKADELLDELESIKSLLDDEQIEIPVLEEMIDDVPPLITDEQERPPTDPSILPGQQALFTEPKAQVSTAKKSPSRDNPFLPKHIRERLGSSNEYVQELEQQQRELEQQSLLMPLAGEPPSQVSSKTKKPQAKTPLQKTIANPDELIDSLVKQYLPIIEDDLRNRLRDLLDDA